VQPNGIYSKYIYQDLIKFRKTQREQKPFNATFDHYDVGNAYEEDKSKVNSQNKTYYGRIAKTPMQKNRKEKENKQVIQSNERKKQKQYTMRNYNPEEETDIQETNENYTNANIETQLKEKDEHIEILRKLLAKAIKIIGSFQQFKGKFCNTPEAISLMKQGKFEKIQRYLDSIHDIGETQQLGQLGPYAENTSHFGGQSNSQIKELKESKGTKPSKFVDISLSSIRSPITQKKKILTKSSMLNKTPDDQK